MLISLPLPAFQYQVIVECKDERQQLALIENKAQEPNLE